MPWRRFWLPIEPLHQYFESREFKQPNERTVHETTHQVQRSIVGVLKEPQRQAYYKGLKSGFISDYQADNIAIQLGKHPSEIWVNWSELIGGY